MKRFIGITVLLTPLTIFFLQGCTRLPTQTAGGSGSETVIGKALMPGGAPAAKAAIHLRSAGYLAPVNWPTTNTGSPRIDAVTDDSGRFSVEATEAGMPLSSRYRSTEQPTPWLSA